MNKKILIVDDEKEIVDLLEVYLSNDGYSVYIQQHGKGNIFIFSEFRKCTFACPDRFS